jgi:hypothetical protein
MMTVLLILAYIGINCVATKAKLLPLSPIKGRGRERKFHGGVAIPPSMEDLIVTRSLTETMPNGSGLLTTGVLLLKEEFTQMLTSCNWWPLPSLPEKFDLNIVREFYANAYGGKDSKA